MFHPFTSALEASIVFARPVPLSLLADRRRNPRPNEVRRRPGKAQGRALEVLAHALEYLVDSELQRDGPTPPEVEEAIQIIAEKNRQVFAECPEIPTLLQRLTCLLPKFLTLTAIDDPGTPSRIPSGSGPALERSGKERP